MIWQYGATVHTCANDWLIRLNKFILRITDGFCNLFFISIRTPHTTPPFDTWCDTPKLYILDLNKALIVYVTCQFQVLLGVLFIQQACFSLPSFEYIWDYVARSSNLLILYGRLASFTALVNKLNYLILDVYKHLLLALFHSVFLPWMLVIWLVVVPK